ncbi:hypothetical protein N9M10_01250 [Hellea sp.]|nr:hypothetical protein [Hellea sp.]
MDVTGFWTGEYSYGAGSQAKVSFEAELTQTGTTLFGLSTEQNTFDVKAGQILIADLFGTAAGRDVSFTKSYTNTSSIKDKILYKGSLSNDGHLITGSWNIIGVFSGSFRMTRAIEQKPKAKAVTAKETEDA